MSEWKKICPVEDIPLLGARVVKNGNNPDIAVFRDAEDNVYAVQDRCPHKNGPLSQGIVAGKHVTCPLHAWRIGLDNGQAAAPDVGCAKPYSTRVVDGVVYVDM